MELILEQMPIVIRSLNVGFLQTLRLFFVTLIGAFPLGLIIAFGSMSRFKPLSYFTRLVVWVVRGTPLMIQLLIIYYFPGLVLDNPIWGGGESGRFLAASVSFILNYACYFSEIYRGGIQGVPVGQEEGRPGAGYDEESDFLPGYTASDDQADCASHVQRDYYPGQRYISGPHYRAAGDHLGRTGIHEGISGNFRRNLAHVLYRRLLSDLERYPDRAPGTVGEEAGLL